MTDFLKRLSAMEPAVLRGAALSIVAFLALFGFEWATEDNALSVTNAIFAVLPLITGLLVRPAVTPNAKVGAESVNVDAPTQYEAGEAAVYPEGTPVDVVPENSPATQTDYEGQHREG